MKIDNAINGIIVICFGSLIIFLSRDFPEVRHIDYGPGFFPTLVGFGLVGAGGFLLVRRMVASEGKVVGWVTGIARSDKETPERGIASLMVQVGAIIFYINMVQYLGFLITMPVMLYCLVWWYNRRSLQAAVCAIVASLIIHSFFYQLMSVPLPWGLLEPYARILTW